MNKFQFHFYCLVYDRENRFLYAVDSIVVYLLCVYRMVSLKDSHGSHEYSFYSNTSLTKANISLPSLKNSVLFSAGTSLSSSQTAQ